MCATEWDERSAPKHGVQVPGRVKEQGMEFRKRMEMKLRIEARILTC